MTTLEDDLRVALRDRAQRLRVPERPTLDGDADQLRRRPGSRWLIAAACLALIAAGVVALAQRQAGETEPARPVDSVVPETTVPDLPASSVVLETPGPAVNGWVALETGIDGDGDISLVRPGLEARRLEVAGSDTADDACPAWSPDGTQLSFGRLTGSSETAIGAAELVIVPVDPDGVASAPTVIGLDGWNVLDGFDPHPCAIWAPDNRWVAFAGGGEVWVVDTSGGEIRRLPDLRPSDLEWRPGTDELAIAGDMGRNREADTAYTPVAVYAVSTNELRSLGAVEAAHLTWSPDGSTLAYTRGENGPAELRLVDADGADDRLLVADTGAANHGIGPIWSPAGDRIAYQRICCGSAEGHEVVLVDVADGSETVIEPPETDGPDGPIRWYPYFVTWSPDGRTLLYAAWPRSEGGPASPERCCLVVVPADEPSESTVRDSNMTSGIYSHQWAATQMWGRQPG